MGLWLIVYLIEHLIVNSQAALWIGDDGSGFVRLVNLLESLPYLQVIEILFIGIPLAVHGVWGVKRALAAKLNSSPTDGKTPAMTFRRNRAFSWQRWTSWILLFGIAAHVVQMRFIHYPRDVLLNGKKQFLNVVSFDDGLYTLASRIGVQLYGPQEIMQFKAEQWGNLEGSARYDAGDEKVFEARQQNAEYKNWVSRMAAFDLKENEVIVAAPSPGKAMLFMVRDTFKNPWMGAAYTIFVLAAAFHAFNGFWTALITWGAILSYRSQKAMLPVGWLGIAFLSFLGIAAIWGSYWINLRN